MKKVCDKNTDKKLNMTSKKPRFQQNDHCNKLNQLIPWIKIHLHFAYIGNKAMKNHRVHHL